MSSPLRWFLLALLGLLIAGAVAFLAIRAVSEKIGISSESPAAGKALAPRAEGPPSKPSTDPSDSVSPTPAPSVTPTGGTAPSGGGTADDYAGGGNGEGGDD